MTKMFVGGLPYAVDSKKLEDLFASFGAVVSAQVITDKFTNQSKGFGFVEMSNDDEAQKAIQELNDSEVEGRRINVSVARPREERPSGGGFGGGNRGGGGGYGGGRDDRRGGGGGNRY
jgi:RNA recognition motif-containing protein